MFHIVIEPIKREMSELLPSEDDNDYTEVFREPLDSECVEFSVGNPRVEHITGIVHLYKRNSAPYGSSAMQHAAKGTSQSTAQVCGTPAGSSRLSSSCRGSDMLCCCMDIGRLSSSAAPQSPCHPARQQCSKQARRGGL
jgi:hypothetical protein